MTDSGSLVPGFQQLGSRCWGRIEGKVEKGGDGESGGRWLKVRVPFCVCGYQILIETVRSRIGWSDSDAMPELLLTWIQT